MFISVYSTPIGQMKIVASASHLYLVEFSDQWNLDAQLADLENRLGVQIREARNALIDETCSQLDQYFAGERQRFDLPYETLGTDFQQSVWQSLTHIPYGETWSYAKQAAFLGRPKAVRAVARANSMNRLPLILPCHRVVGSNGTLTGYAGGLARKQWLLEHEQGCRKD